MPITRLPSGCRSMVNTHFVPDVEATPVPGLKVASREPLPFNRAMPLRGVPWEFEKDPPIMIFPSGCTQADSTKLFAPDPGLNPVSRLPSALRRAM